MGSNMQKHGGWLSRRMQRNRLLRNARTVKKITGEAPDTQSVRDITEPVTERWVEEIPPSTQEKVPIYYINFW